jgi:hypothetical protein
MSLFDACLQPHRPLCNVLIGTVRTSLPSETMTCPVTGSVFSFRALDITCPFLCSRRWSFGRNGIRFVKN